MITYNNQQYVELFHLLFLDFLGRKVDKRFYALKGGCNLRFYMRSFRYSEDMDLDVEKIPKEKLEDIVTGILKSKPFTEILKAKGMAINKWSTPKQTDTTQRWKIGLQIHSSDILLPTKIEFSRRGMKQHVTFETVDSELIRTYQLTPIMANHYDAQAAYEQKIEALITRSAIQARDVFDLYILLGMGALHSISNKNLKERLDEAISNALSVTFDIFKSQVFSFLHEDYQARYNDEGIWNDMVLNVVQFLEKGKT